MNCFHKELRFISILCCQIWSQLGSDFKMYIVFFLYILLSCHSGSQTFSTGSSLNFPGYCLWFPISFTILYVVLGNGFFSQRITSLPWLVSAALWEATAHSLGTAALSDFQTNNHIISHDFYFLVLFIINLWFWWFLK